MTKPTELHTMKTQPPSIKLPPAVPMQKDGSVVGTPLGELVDRKDLDGLYSAIAIDEGKPRRRSITEGSLQG